ncbi:MAG: beta strand repeat-containing protein [Chloroflexota bacterium]
MNVKIHFTFGSQRLFAPHLAHALRVALIALVLAALSMTWSAPGVVRAGGAFVVNSSSDNSWVDSVLTLREAIDVANGTLTGPFTAGEQAQLGGCTFDGSGMITGGCGGGVYDNITFHSTVTQINLINTLPALTDAGTWIDGNAGVPRINASGINPLGDVFTINGNHITISHLSVVNGDSGSFADIAVLSGKDARIAYNYLGSVPGATNCSPSGVTRNSRYGVYVAPNSSGSSGANNGVAYIYGNIIGCHSLHGVYVSGADFVYIGVQPDGSTLDANLIGISPAPSDLGNGGDGVHLEASGSDGVRWNVVKQNHIDYNDGNGIGLVGTGFNSSGSTQYNWIQSNTILSNTLSGIRLTEGAYINYIGGGGSGDGNIIGWNGADGITVLKSNGNLMQGNLIGTYAITNYGNSQAGVYLEVANGNTLSSNVISANGWAGVWVLNSTGNTIKGNKIGTNENGTAAMANGHDGVALTDGSQENTIGGTTLADRNVISGNTNCGIILRDGANYNTIDYNLIGLNAAGTNAIPNGLAGVCVFSGSNGNNIGSSSSVVSQYISGNTREGVYIEYSDGNIINSSNGIGVATDNTTARGNGLQGVMLYGAYNTNVCPILVAYNGGAGIAVIGDTATRNDIIPLQVRNNGGLPIDLGNDGHTPNGSQIPPGPNNWLNYPVITSASGNPVTLSGTACANCRIIIYRAIGNPAAPGGGGVYIQNTTANAGGSWSATLPAGMGRNDVTLLARDPVVNTSEMSPRPLSVYLPLIIK